MPTRIARAREKIASVKLLPVVDRENWLFLGRGSLAGGHGCPEVEEISYIHAEGMPAAEMGTAPLL